LGIRKIIKSLPHSGRNDLKNGKTAKTAKKRENGEKTFILSQLGVFVLNFVVFGLVLTIFEVILANSAMNPQKHDGRLLLEKNRETKFVNKIQKFACFKVNFDPF
jgi:hypothetical protein